MEERECIDCEDIREAVDTVCGGSKQCLNDLAVAWIISREGPLGRITLSRRLGLSERRVRSSIGRLRAKNIIEVDPVAGVYATSNMPPILRSLTCIEADTRTLITLENPCPALIDVVERRVVDIRDAIVIATGTTDVEIIGYSIEGKLHAPHVPENLLAQYKRVLENRVSGDNILVVLKGVKPAYMCPAILIALNNVCSKAEIE